VPLQSHALPSFIPEGYTPITEAIAATDGGWPALRQHLNAGRVRGFILTDERRLVRVPKTDWASPKNDGVGATGVVTKLTRIHLGDRIRQGFALVNTRDLETIKLPPRPNVIAVPSKPKGRPRGAGSLAEADQPLLHEMRDLLKAGKAYSIWAAAGEVADCAEGGGTIESKRKRLAKRYKG
jgi:hypothetical protein